MKQQNIQTSIGTIAVYKKVVPGTVPVLFLHGVYFDHHLWNYFTSRITDRTVIAIDMPHHGNSKSIIQRNWNMTDCGQMLIEIIEDFGYDKVFAVGHSWGSMTILRAAVRNPHKFIAIGLCNMPLRKGSFKSRLQFGFQHWMLPFKSFYAKQVAKVMFSKENRRSKPEMTEYLEVSIARLSNQEVKKTDRAVITHVDDGVPYLEQLRVPAQALKGDSDYVGTPLNIKNTLVKGAHTSPLEQPEAVLKLINKLFLY